MKVIVSEYLRIYVQTKMLPWYLNLPCTATTWHWQCCM